MTSVNSILIGTQTNGLIGPLFMNGDNNLITASNLSFPNGQVLLGTTEGLAIQADSVPVAKADPQNRPGWYYTNPNLGDKMNWYYYSGQYHGYTIADLRLINATLFCDNVEHKPFFVVYTKPLGSGDLIPGFAHSSRTYTTPDLLIEGEKCIFFYGESGYVPANNEKLKLVPYQFSHDDGLVEPGMQIAYISIHSDSSTPAKAYAVCVENLGFRLINETLLYTLATPPIGGGVSSNVNVISSVELAVSNASLANLTFTGTKALTVTQNNISKSVSFGSTDFSSLLTGGYTASNDIKLSNLQSIYGNAVHTNMMGVNLNVEYSADGTTWYKSNVNIAMMNGVDFCQTLQLGGPFVRFVLQGDITTINLVLSTK